MIIVVSVCGDRNRGWRLAEKLADERHLFHDSIDIFPGKISSQTNWLSSLGSWRYQARLERSGEVS